MIVYLVICEEEYEDSWCEGVFSTQEKAENFLHRRGFEKESEYKWKNVRPKRSDTYSARIEKYEVDDEAAA